MNRKTLATLALLAVAPFAHAGDTVTCKVNAMTDARYCSTDPGRAAMGGFYFMATNDDGKSLGVVVSQTGYSNRPSGDVLYVRVDGAPVMKITALQMDTDVDCHRGACRWNQAAVANPTAAQWAAIAAGSDVKVALGDTAGPESVVSQMDASLVARWLADFAAMGIRP